MKTRAPELSALIIIFGSAGPVISTRRSSKSAGAGATVQSASRISRVPGRKSSRSPASSAACRSCAPVEQVQPDVAEAALEVGDERQRLVGQDALSAGTGGPVTTTPAAASGQSSARRTVASMSPCGSVVAT